MSSTKAKPVLLALIGLICSLLFGGLAFAVASLSASAAILPDRFDPDRFTAVTFPELAEPEAQKYYADGYWVVQDMEYKTLGYSDPETSGVFNSVITHNELHNEDYEDYYLNLSVSLISSELNQNSNYMANHQKL